MTGGRSMTFFDDFVIDSMEDLVDLIRDVGFVPFFSNEIEGFSIEEHINPALWYDSGDTWEAWDWKGPVIRKTKCAYGKFFKGKAMYISAKWFPDFANYRRVGKRFTDKVYQRSPMESYERVVKHFQKILPGVTAGEIRKLLGK